MIGNIRYFSKIRLTSLSTKRAVDVFLNRGKNQYSKNNKSLLLKEKIPDYKELYKAKSSNNKQNK